jgi:hypothetical protein
MPRPQLQRVGPYRTLEAIAQGGAAEIWLVAREGSSELAVLKRVLPQHLEDEAVLRRLRREARITSQLFHPNVVRLLWAGEDGDRFLTVSELVRGVNLDELRRAHIVARGEPLPLGVAVHAARSLLEGLAYVHGALGEDGKPLGLVHRDLSSSNVLVGFDGAVKIADFGVARANLDGFKTRVGVLLGTAEYMSPEQTLGLQVDVRTDLYAAGAILYELLTGEPVVERGRPLAEMLEQVRTGVPLPPTRRVPSLPSALDEFMRRALAKLPHQRFQSASEMRDALLAAIRPHAAAPPHELGLLASELAPQALARFAAWDAVAPALVGSPEETANEWETLTRAVDRTQLSTGIAQRLTPRAVDEGRTTIVESPRGGRSPREVRPAPSADADRLRTQVRRLQLTVGVLGFALAFGGLAAAWFVTGTREVASAAIGGVAGPSPVGATVGAAPGAVPVESPLPAAIAAEGPQARDGSDVRVAARASEASRASPRSPRASAPAVASASPRGQPEPSTPPSPSTTPDAAHTPRPRGADPALLRAMSAARAEPTSTERVDALVEVLRARAKRREDARALLVEIDAAERAFDVEALLSVAERLGQPSDVP